MTIIFGQCDDTTRTKISLGESYKTNCEAGELIKFLTRVCKVCNGSNNGGLFLGAHVSKLPNIIFGWYDL